MVAKASSGLTDLTELPDQQRLDRSFANIEIGYWISLQSLAYTRQIVMPEKWIARSQVVYEYNNFLRRPEEC